MSVSVASTSKPHYGHLAFKRARHHLFIADRFGLARVAQLIAGAPPDGTATLAALLLVEDGVNVQAHRWPQDMHADTDQTAFDVALSARLTVQPMDSHVYVSGTEAFVTEVLRMAHLNKVASDAISTELAGPTLRNVQCAHCKTMYPRVTTRAIHCTVCDVPLVVRDHFSSRLGAYQAILLREPNEVIRALMSEPLS